MSCNNDDDCLNNEYCSFEPDTLTRKCISKNDLKIGCVDNNYIKNIKKIDSYDKNDHISLDNCINFSRKQTTNDGLNYNYMIYKNKKNTPINIDDIKFNLSCDEINNINLTNNEFFKLLCNEDNEECNIKSKPILEKLLKDNNCNNLNINYSCTNENLEKNINIDMNNKKNIDINITCPIENDNELLNSKCSSIMIDDNSILNNINKNNFKCLNPIYKIPISTDNINKYKELKNQQLTNKINEYDNKIKFNNKELNDIKINKYIAEYEYQNGRSITYEQAKKLIDYEEERKNIEKKNIEKITNETQNETDNNFNTIKTNYYNSINNRLNNDINKLNINNDSYNQKIYISDYKNKVNNSLIIFFKYISIILFLILIFVLIYINVQFNTMNN